MKRTLRIGLSCLVIVSMALMLATCAKKPRTVKLELKFTQGTKADYTIGGKGNLVAHIESPKQGKKDFQINFDGALALKSEVKSVSPEGNGTIALKVDKIKLNLDNTIPDVPDKYKKISAEIDTSKILITDASGAAIFDSSKTASGGMNPAMFVLPILSQEWTFTVDKTGKTLDFEMPQMLKAMAQQAQPGKDLKAGLKFAESKYPSEPIEVGKSYVRKYKMPVSEKDFEEISFNYTLDRIEQFEGMECAVLKTAFDMNLMKYIKKAIASAPMPLPNKDVLDKATATVKVNATTRFAIEKGYEPRNEGDIILTGAFDDPKEGKADINCKIHFTVSEKRT